MKIAVFCSSSENVAPMYLSEIDGLGEALAAAGHTIVYGGCDTGCMGALARGALRKKGKVIGVIPQMDFAADIVQEGLTEQKVVPTLASRKEAMNTMSDGFIVYPGGLGTLDEAFEVLALKSLGTINKPVVFYNFLETWDPMLEALELLAARRMIRHDLSELFIIANQREQLLEVFKK